MTNTKIDLGILFRHIESLDVSTDESKFLERIFKLSRNIFSPETCENFIEIDLPIDFSVLKELALKYGFIAVSINHKSYICWQKFSLPKTPYCDVAEFFRQIQRVKLSETLDSLERFEIYKEICDILSELNHEYKFQHLIPVRLSFCSDEKANLIAKEYGFHVASGAYNKTYLGIADKIQRD